MQVRVPNGVAPGGQFQVQYQPIAAAQPMQAVAVGQPMEAGVVMGTAAPQMVAPQMVAPQPMQPMQMQPMQMQPMQVQPMQVQMQPMPMQPMQPALVAQVAELNVTIPRAPGQMLGLNLAERDGAVLIHNIHEGHAASACGLVFGDEVVKVGQTAVMGMGVNDVYGLIGQIPQGAPVQLTIRRKPHVGPPPPRGCPPGGVWKDERYCGTATCLVVLCVCPMYALCALFCPLDTRRVYQLPNGTRYDVNGNEIVEHEGVDAPRAYD